ncbi:MAG: hypothetical protein FWC41_10755 [Firmicutes bacterium]|nr:hypothetical protein [Bacillota bacterium]
MKKLTRENFIEKAKSVHGEKYDYSKVEYNGNKDHVCIICTEHGEFWVTPVNHCSKHNKCGCPKCVGRNRTTEEFIEQSKKIHGGKYDYSKTEYVDYKTKVCIICPEHGEFWQSVCDHMFNGNGCPKCGTDKLKKLFTKNTNDFIKEANKLYYNKYDYSKFEYKGAKIKSTVICHHIDEITGLEHGEFIITPTSHLHQMVGCPRCNTNLINEKRIEQLLLKNNIKYILHYHPEFYSRFEIDFFLPDYNIGVEYQGEQHFHPVKYMGGEERYFRSLECDKRKYDLCKENGIRLIYFTKVKRKIIPNNYLDEIFTEEQKLVDFILRT